MSYIINPRVRFWNSSAAYEMYTLWRMENVKSNRTHNKFWCQWSSLRGLNDGYRTWWKASQLLLPSQQYNWTITHQPQVLSHNDIYKTKDWKKRDRRYLILEMTTQCWNRCGTEMAPDAILTPTFIALLPCCSSFHHTQFKPLHLVSGFDVLFVFR